MARPLLPGSPSTDDSTDSMPEQQLSEHDGKDGEPSEVVLGVAPSCSTKKSWLHFRPSPVDFCGSRLAIGAATERARALAMPAGTRAQALQTRANSLAASSLSGHVSRWYPSSYERPNAA